MMSKDFKNVLGKTATAVDPEEVTMDRPKGKEIPIFALSEEDKERVHQKARGIVAAKFKKAAEEKYLQEAIKEIERESIPEQRVEPLLINVAGHAAKITIDGRPYEHGKIYNVTQSERETLEEIMARTWNHEHEVGGANGNQYRRPANAVLRPGSEIMPISQLVRV